MAPLYRDIDPARNEIGCYRQKVSIFLHYP